MKNKNRKISDIIFDILSTMSDIKIDSRHLSELDKKKIIGICRKIIYILPIKQDYDPQRMTILYFLISTLEIMNSLEGIDKESLIDWIYAMQILPSSDDYTGKTFDSLEYSIECHN